ncbi:MAG: ABC transporter ATP-binding protein [Nitrososphaerales archaeon]
MKALTNNNNQLQSVEAQQIVKEEKRSTIHNFSTNENVPLLQVKDLKVAFEVARSKVVVAVDRVNFELNRGEILGIVGESGSGKTMTALSILKLLPKNAKMQGEVLYHKETWQNIAKLSEKKLTSIRGGEIAMVFQDPLSSLNPVHKVGDQIVEAIRLHRKISKKLAMKEAIDLMRQVGIQSPEKRARDYPHQLSGGMRQRIMIAMALSCRPNLLIADEPTTMIDEISQMQIIELLKKLKDNFGAILYITHDLGVVAELCTRVAVMYAGRIVEIGSVDSIFARPKHPYTKMLIESIPRVDKTRQDLVSIPGMITTNVNPKDECRFVDRCPYAEQKCRERLPELEETNDSRNHLTACIRWKDIFPN